jgi:hypothetical protein
MDREVPNRGTYTLDEAGNVIEDDPSWIRGISLRREFWKNF